jgi:hypothetical protein
MCDAALVGTGGMLRWLWRGMGDHGAQMGAILGVFDELYNPGAARAQDELRAQHERVQPLPSPGDKMLSEGRVTIASRAKPTGD